ncbi:MAG: DUF1489 domain-containing protein [Rhodobacteraceae bacterium]|nr:DUF1489 domain-containing protein [Paracoccaceae bacterium]
MTLHLLKLCVGTESVEELAAWQAGRAAARRAAGADARPRHVTRMWPRRAEELLNGGSLYWVIKGHVLARQRILALEPSDGADGIRRCALLLDPELVRTAPQPRRAFQGWRYLQSRDAPADLLGSVPSDLPPALAVDLARIGVL